MMDIGTNGIIFRYQRRSYTQDLLMAAATA